MTWEPYHSGTSLFVVNKRNNAIICRIMVGDASADVRDTNARLIAAAPDLLEALEYVLNSLTDDDYSVAYAAIAKARGE